MFELLVKIMMAAALAELGVGVSEIGDCHSRICLQIVEKRSRDVLRIEWRPISVFPEEAKRFRESL